MINKPQIWKKSRRALSVSCPSPSRWPLFLLVRSRAFLLWNFCSFCPIKVPFSSTIAPDHTEGRYKMEVQTPTAKGDEGFLLSPQPLSAGNEGSPPSTLVEQKLNIPSRSSHTQRTSSKV
jgi:hypothetical protein